LSHIEVLKQTVALVQLRKPSCVQKPWNTLLDLKFVAAVAMAFSSHQNLSKHAILSALVQRARVLCNERAELKILKDRQNSYSDHQIRKALNPPA
jgi:hypothetical protein